MIKIIKYGYVAWAMHNKAPYNISSFSWAESTHILVLEYKPFLKAGINVEPRVRESRISRTLRKANTKLFLYKQVKHDREGPLNLTYLFYNKIQ